MARGPAALKEIIEKLSVEKEETRDSRVVIIRKNAVPGDPVASAMYEATLRQHVRDLVADGRLACVIQINFDCAPDPLS